MVLDTAYTMENCLVSLIWFLKNIWQLFLYTAVSGTGIIVAILYGQNQILNSGERK